MNQQTFGKIVDLVGFLTLNETGAIIASGGDLENDEKTAKNMFDFLSITDKIDGITNAGEKFNKISVCFSDFCFVISMSNKKIHVVKRKFSLLENNSISAAAEPHLIDLQVPTRLTPDKNLMCYFSTGFPAMTGHA